MRCSAAVTQGIWALGADWALGGHSVLLGLTSQAALSYSDITQMESDRHIITHDNNTRYCPQGVYSPPVICAVSSEASPVSGLGLCPGWGLG